MYNDGCGTDGRPRVYRESKAQGVACSVNRVARLMLLRSLLASQDKQYKITIWRNQSHPVAAVASGPASGPSPSMPGP